MLSQRATLEIASGYTLSGFSEPAGALLVIGNSGTEILTSGGSDAGTQVLSGGTDIISSGGVTSDATVSSGGTMELALGASAPGLSVQSGEPIPDGRLEAIPWAERTAEEQSRYERLGG